MKKVNLNTESKYLLTFVTMLFMSVCTYPQTNLIVDPGFENGSFDWLLTRGASRVASNANSGSWIGMKIK